MPRIFHMLLVDELELVVQMQNHGCARLKGYYWHNSLGNKLQFELDTDQTCLGQVIQSREE